MASLTLDVVLYLQLLYDVAVPENLIRLSRKEQEQGKALVEVRRVARQPGEDPRGARRFKPPPPSNVRALIVDI